jgi:AraC-like DNA-binding protein
MGTTAAIPGLREDGGRFRETFGERSHAPTLLPELRMLGWARFPRAATDGLGEHRHPGAFEVCYIADGPVEWWVEGETYAVPRGHAYVTLPDERHGGAHAVMHPCEIFWAQVAFPFVGLSGAENDLLAGGLGGVTRRAFPVPAAVPDLFARLMDEHRRVADAVAVVAARGLLHALLAAVVRAHAEAERLSPPAPSPAVAAALAWMEARLCEPFTVEEAAAAAGMGAAAFHERFAREVGETPADWRARRRIERAKRRLLDDPAASVTDTAFALGFASSQYFATAFRRYTGLTPSGFRRRAASATGEAATSSRPDSSP